MNITELLWWVYSHFMYRKWNKKIKASLCNWQNEQAFRHVQTWAAFSACIRQPDEKRSPPPTNVASLASLGNDSNSNDAVAKIKVRNCEALTNFGCLVWETWSPGVFFQSVLEDIMLSRSLSLVAFAAGTAWLLCRSEQRCSGVSAWKMRAV